MISELVVVSPCHHKVAVLHNFSVRLHLCHLRIELGLKVEMHAIDEKVLF